MPEPQQVNGTAAEHCSSEGDGECEHEPHFVPIVYLPEVHIPTMEEHEDEVIRQRCKLFRFDNTCDPPEWKERGTGDIKIMRHRERNTFRVVMRRDRTLKICANFAVASWMELKPNCGSDRAWVWSVNADYADEEPKPELLAARFANSDEAKKWFDAFEEAKKSVAQGGSETQQKSDSEGEDLSESEEEGEAKKSEQSKVASKDPEADKKSEEASGETSNETAKSPAQSPEDSKKQQPENSAAQEVTALLSQVRVEDDPTKSE